MDNQMPASSGGEIIDLPAPGQQDPVDVTHVEDLTVWIKKITTTDEGRLQVVLESEGMDNAAIGQVKDMLLLQQTCLVKVSMKPVQQDLLDA